MNARPDVPSWSSGRTRRPTSSARSRRPRRRVTKRLEGRVRVRVSFAAVRDQLITLLKEKVGGRLSEALETLRTIDQLSLSELATAGRNGKDAAKAGPQDITVHGRSVAVVVSRELFDRLSGNEQSLVDFMLASPLSGHDEISFERDRSLPREITF